MRIASLVLEARCRRSSRLQGATIRSGSWRRQLSRLLRKIRSGQVQTGLNCAEPSLPDLAFSSFPKCCLEEHDLPSDKPIRFAIRTFSTRSMLALAHSGSLDLPFLIPFGFFFPVVRLVDEVVGGDSSYSRCWFPSAEIPIPANRKPDANIR